MTLNEMRDEAYATSKSKGWYEKGRRDIPTLLCLIHSEVSEALEAWRETGDEGIADESKRAARHGYGGDKPEGVAAELADVVIRIGDMAGAYEIDLDLAMVYALTGETERRRGKLFYTTKKFDLAGLLNFIHADISKAHETFCTFGEEKNPYGPANRPSEFAKKVGVVLAEVYDLCSAYDIDLNAAVKAKMAFNKTRSHRHGGKKV